MKMPLPVRGFHGTGRALCLGMTKTNTSPMENTQKTVTLQCSTDVTGIGDSATREELDQYHANLASLIEREFGVSVHRINVSGRDACPESHEINNRIREIESTDEWISLL